MSSIKPFLKTTLLFCAVLLTAVLFFCTRITQPGPTPPRVTAVTDTTVFVYDTIILRAAGDKRNGAAVRYVWFDSLFSSRADTLDDTIVTMVFQLPDTGTHTISVRAYDKATRLFSSAETLSVTVMLGAPRVRAMHDTTVLACDTFSLYATATDTNGVITEYRWFTDNAPLPVISDSGTWPVTFLTRDTGIHRIQVQSLDDDGIPSRTDTIHVTVIAPKPIISVDTAISITAGDSLSVNVTRLDSIGLISGYRWFVNNDSGFTTIDPVRTCFFRDTGDYRIIVYAYGKAGVTSDPDTLVVHVRPFHLTFAGMNDTIIHIYDTLKVSVKLNDSIRAIKGYQWTIGNAPQPVLTDTPALNLVFSLADTGIHTLALKAFDRSGVFTQRDTMNIRVYAHTPAIRAMNDTTVAINDPVYLHAHGSDSGSIRLYEWVFDSGKGVQFTADSGILAVWKTADSGTHVVRVRTQNNDNLWSKQDTVMVSVHPYRPSVTAMPDAMIPIIDSINLKATASDTNGLIRHYIWAIHDSLFRDTTPYGSINAAWMVNDTGIHTVRVRAIDDDGLVSSADSIRVTVKNLPPVLISPHDTVLHQQDTLNITLAATDSNGSVSMYLCSQNSVQWSDSTSSPALQIFYRGIDTVHVRVGVRDDDGLLTTDSFKVVFKRPLVFLTVSAPLPDSIILISQSDWPTQRGKVSFAMNARDTAGIGGFAKYQYTMYLNTDSTRLLSAQVYRGIDTLVAIATLDTVKYYWAVRANNKEDTTWAYGSFTLRLQKRLGFVGHSVVVGYRGDSGTGGFRKMVIDTLRAKLGGHDAIKCVGPAVTNRLMPPEDDSSLAANGTRAWHLLDSLYYHPDYTADIWVLMIGVNGGYVYWEEIDAIALIDTLHMRNPNASMYILNGIPLPPDGPPQWVSANDLARFNRNLASAVVRRKAYNWNIHLVDAYHAMAPDDVFPANLYPQDEVAGGEPLHPTQEGNDLIAKEILRVMQQAKQW